MGNKRTNIHHKRMCQRDEKSAQQNELMVDLTHVIANFGIANETSDTVCSRTAAFPACKPMTTSTLLRYHARARNDQARGKFLIHGRWKGVYQALL